jgi:hypothetical protein
LDLAALHRALLRAWSAETSYDPEHWTPSNPAWGQCAVTSLIVQDFAGGDIVVTEARLPNGGTTKHFYNKFYTPSVCEIDLTRDQFPPGTLLPHGNSIVEDYPSVREYILAFPSTVQRYQALHRAVLSVLSRLDAETAHGERTED